MRLRIEAMLCRVGYTVSLDGMSDEEVYLRAAVVEKMLEDEAREMEKQMPTKGKGVARFG